MFGDVCACVAPVRGNGARAKENNKSKSTAGERGGERGRIIAQTRARYVRVVL